VSKGVPRDALSLYVGRVKGYVGRVKGSLATEWVTVAEKRLQIPKGV
jgi:hypothetical protein